MGTDPDWEDESDLELHGWEWRERERLGYVNMPPGELGKATEKDLKAGYSHCMFCVEMGDEEHHSVHDVLWDRWADAENSAF